MMGQLIGPGFIAGLQNVEHRNFFSASVDSLQQLLEVWSNNKGIKSSQVENRSDLYIVNLRGGQTWKAQEIGVKFRDVKKVDECHISLRQIEVKVRRQETEEGEVWEKVVRKKLNNKIIISIKESDMQTTKETINALLEQQLSREYFQPGTNIDDIKIIEVEKWRFAENSSGLSIEETPIRVVQHEQNGSNKFFSFSVSHEGKSTMSDPDSRVKQFKNSLEKQWSGYSFIDKHTKQTFGYPEFLLTKLLK